MDPYDTDQIRGLQRRRIIFEGGSWDQGDSRTRQIRFKNVWILVRATMKREHRREFLIQEALLEAQHLTMEGHGTLADLVNDVATVCAQLQGEAPQRCRP